MKWGFIIFVFLNLAGRLEGGKILAFLPLPAKSHQRFFQPILRELGLRGHEMTVYTTLSMEDPPPKYNEVLIEDNIARLLSSVDIKNYGEKSAWGQLISLYNAGLNHTEWICSLPYVQDLFESTEKYDAVILESTFAQEAYSYLGHKFKAPQIDFVTLGDNAWVNYLSGVPHNPSYMLDLRSPWSDGMTLWERAQNALVYLGIVYITSLIYMPKYQSLADRCFKYNGWENRPPIEDLLLDKSLYLINNHVSIGLPQPTVPNVIHIGGASVRPKKNLPKDLQKFMDDSKEGVILFSLGSNFRVSEMLVGELRESVLQVFRSLSQRVIMKWEGELIENNPNLKVMNWLPQQDILAHENCKLFITHAGFNGLMEAVYYGVPMIGIPFFADQPKNVKHMVHHGYGIHVDYKNLTKSSLSWAINEILTNDSYKKAAISRSKIFLDWNESPLNRSIYWIEYVMRHKGADHLKTRLRKLPWYKSLFVDVALMVSIFLIFIYSFISKLIRAFKSFSHQKKDESKND